VIICDLIKFINLTGGIYLFLIAESFAFYLSRLLGMDNVPEVVISNISSPLWKGTDFINLGWREHDLVAMIRWLHHTR
jgi:hypothetical protein